VNPPDGEPGPAGSGADVPTRSADGQWAARVPHGERARRVRFREWRRESLWFWPCVAIAAAWVTGEVLVARGPSFVVQDHLVSSDVSSEQAVLSTVATAILTFTGVVFSISLVALQVASSQYSPRLVRSFVRKPASKIALSVFLATFVYSVTVLAGIGTTLAGGRPPAAAVGVAYVLSLASVVVFTFFVHSMVRSMRVSYVIDDLASETRRSLDRAVPRSSGIVDAAQPMLVSDPVLLRFQDGSRVLAGVDVAALVAVAQRHDCVLRLQPRIGAYLVEGRPFLEVHGGRVPEWDEIRRCLELGTVRALYQEARYGVRQLVDIAARALSPAVNDPTTAVQVIERLHGLLAHIIDRPDPPSAYVDITGTVRLLRTVPDWEQLVQLSFVEIIRYGSGAPQVSRRLLTAFDDLERQAPPGREVAVLSLRAWLLREVEQRGDDPEFVRLASRPDDLGLG